MSDQPALMDVPQKKLAPIDRKAEQIARFRLYVHGTHEGAIKAIEKDVQFWRDQYERRLADWGAIPLDRRAGNEHLEPKPYDKEIAIEERAIDILKRGMPVESR